jgi:hypothetical protein
MNEFAGWLARSAGIGHELATRIDRAEWHWARPAALWIGLALLVPVGVWIARRHASRMPWLSPGMRRTLTACRIGVLALLVFILAGPFVRLDETIEERPVVAVVRDASASMDLPVGRLPAESVPGLAGAVGLDQPAPEDTAAITALGERLAGWTRRQLLDSLLATQAATTLRQLGDRFEVREYEVGRRPLRLANPDPAAADAAPADSTQPATTAPAANRPAGLDPSDTALGEALELAIDDASGRGLAAIVLITDGVSTRGVEPVAVVRRAAEATGGAPRGPLFAVPIGGPEPPPDVAVAEILAPPEVTLDDTVSLTAMVRSVGLVGRTTVVELRDAAGNVLESKPLDLSDGRRQVAFAWKATQAGRIGLTVAIPPQDGEATAENNSRDLSVDVTTRTLKTLVVDDAARWDTRFLDHAIRRDKGFAPTLVLASAAKPDDTLPEDAEGWAAYDLVLLGDVPVTLLDEDRQRALIEAVERRGVGVVFQPGGEHLPKEYAGAPLAALFPLEFDAAGEGTAAVEAPDFEPLAMAVTARGAMHPAFAISGDAAGNRKAWSEMPPFFRAAAVGRPKPSATVLAEVADPRGRGTIPLVAEAPFGRGRTAWIGTEETFRWRRNVGDPVFWRFWGQALRSIARRDDRPWDTSWLVVEPGSCEPGSSVFVELNLVDGDKQPVEVAVQQVGVAFGEATTSLELTPAERPGLYRGAYTPEGVGRHVLTATSAAGPLSADLAVQASSRELARTAVDRGALRVLADLTGGAVLEPDAFSTLPYRLAETAVETSRTLEDDVWDTWPVLVLLVGLYCVDIGIRRLSGSA